MAVEARYYSTRDPNRTMFADKKEADAHDRLLEATEEVAAVIEAAHDSMDADLAYLIATAIMERREDLLVALKKAPKPADRPAPEANAEESAPVKETARPRKKRAA